MTRRRRSAPPRLPYQGQAKPYLGPAFERTKLHVELVQGDDPPAERSIWRDLWKLLVRVGLVIAALPVRRPVRPVLPPRTYVVLADLKSFRPYLEGVRAKDRHLHFPVANRATALGVIPREGDQVLVMTFPLHLDPYVLDWLRTWTSKAKVIYRHSDWEKLL